MVFNDVLLGFLILVKQENCIRIWRFHGIIMEKSTFGDLMGLYWKIHGAFRQIMKSHSLAEVIQNFTIKC